MIINIAGIRFVFDKLNSRLEDYIKSKYNKFVCSSNNFKHSILVNFYVENPYENMDIDTPKLGVSTKENGYIFYLKESGNNYAYAHIDHQLSFCRIVLGALSWEIIDLFLSVLWRIISSCQGAILLHASAFLYQHKSIICCAHSGGGKSTFLELMKNTELTDEMSCITFKSVMNPRYTAIPWRDMSEKRKWVQVGAILILSKSPKATVELLPEKIAKMYIRKYLYFNFWLYDSKSKVNEAIDALVKCVPVMHCGFSLENTPKDLISLIEPKI